MNPANGSPKLQFVCGLAAGESSDPESCTPLMSSYDMDPTNSSAKLQSSSELREESQPDPESGIPPMSLSEMSTTSTRRPTVRREMKMFEEKPACYQGSITHNLPEPSGPAKYGSPSFPLCAFPKSPEYFHGTDQPNNVARRSNFVTTITTIINKKDKDVPAISIFKVPNSLTSGKPEAYAPKLVGIGPVHHSRPELQHMQMYKVLEAKRIHNGFESDLEFGEVIEVLNQIVGPYIRAYYSIYLEMEEDVLACVMAVDCLFLLDMLCRHGISKEALEKSSSLSHLVNSSGRRLPQKTIIQEAMMLENQIPIFVLKVILIIECWQVEQDKEKEIVSDLFPNILLDFCKYVSPLKTVENYPLHKALNHAHLLDLLYHLVTLERSPECNSKEEEEEQISLVELSEKVRNKIRGSKPPVMQSKMASDNYMFPFSLDMESNRIISDAINVAAVLAPAQLTKPLKLVRSLFDELPRFRSLISSLDKEEAPTKKIFLFPTASELKKVGVQFFVVDRIRNISFDPETASFYLPFIRLNGYFEVIIRNLAAYEAMIISEEEPPILNWYVELMNGLIETAEDVNVLRGKGIISKRDFTEDKKVIEGIVSKPESIDDEQVAKIFSGMNKSVELINIPNNLDKAIRDVQKYYADATRSASELTFMEKCRRIASKWFHVFAVLLALFLLSVQTVCSVYECPRFSFKTSNIITPQAQQGSQLPSLRSHLM